MNKRVLVIDDEVLILDALETILQEMGPVVHTSENAADGERRALEETYDLVITDLRMPNRNGAEVVESVLAVKPEVKFLVVTAFPQDPLAKRALDAGAVGLVRKPFDMGKILRYLL